VKVTRRTVLAAAASTLAVPAVPATGWASPGWPTKGTIRLIATFPPGGTADTISRILAPKLSAALGTQVVVENKPGARGTIGSDLAAKAKPDEIAFGSSGIGSNTHLMGEQLSGLAGIKLKHVPYKGSAPSLQDMLAGAIPSMFDPITTNVPHINAGKVRVLAISSATRIAMYPGMATFAEQGFPQMTTSTWVGVSGPKGLAPEVVTRLYDEVQKAYKAPDVQERFKDVVLLPEDKAMTPTEYARFVGDFAAIWTKVSKDAGISLEIG